MGWRNSRSDSICHLVHRNTNTLTGGADAPRKQWSHLPARISRFQPRFQAASCPELKISSSDLEIYRGAAFGGPNSRLAAQGPSLKFQALGSLPLEVLARTLKSSPRGVSHFFLGECWPHLCLCETINLQIPCASLGGADSLVLPRQS